MVKFTLSILGTQCSIRRKLKVCFGVSRLGPEPGSELRLSKLMTAVAAWGSEHPKIEESLTYSSRLILHHGVASVQLCRDDVFSGC